MEAVANPECTIERGYEAARRRKFGNGKDVWKPAAIEQRADGGLAINDVETGELKIGVAKAGHVFVGWITRGGKHHAAGKRCGTAQNELQIGEEIEHEVLADDELPVRIALKAN